MGPLLSSTINIQGIFEHTKAMQFEEFFGFVTSKNHELSFKEFNRNVGISRRQWDILKERNVDNKDIKWAIE